MTTNKQMIEAADNLANKLKKLTDGLAKDGVALDGFTEALKSYEDWQKIKLKKAFERLARSPLFRDNHSNQQGQNR